MNSPAFIERSITNGNKIRDPIHGLIFSKTILQLIRVVYLDPL